MTWYPINDSAVGSEGGTVVHDDEHSQGARITLERDTEHAPFAITCGIYGWMFHTRFVATEAAAESSFASMKSDMENILAMIQRYEALADRSTYEAVIEKIERLVKEFS